MVFTTYNAMVLSVRAEIWLKFQNYVVQVQLTFPETLCAMLGIRKKFKAKVEKIAIFTLRRRISFPSKGKITHFKISPKS